MTQRIGDKFLSGRDNYGIEANPDTVQKKVQTWLKVIRLAWMNLVVLLMFYLI